MSLLRHRYYELDQLLGCHLGEDWDTEYDGVYEAAETWIVELPDEFLRVLVGDIVRLFAEVTDPSSRMNAFSNYAFRSPEQFDTWLRAVRDRAAEAVAGVHHHPLVDPPS